MFIKKGILYYEFLAFYLNIGMIIELLDKILLLLNIKFEYLSFLQQGLYLFIGSFLFLYILKDNVNIVNNILKLCFFISVLLVSLIINPSIKVILVKSFIYFITQVYLVYCFVINAKELRLLINALKKYILFAVIFAFILFILYRNDEYAYSMDFSYKSFLSAALSFLLFCKEKKSRYFLAFIFIAFTNFRVGSRGIFLCYIFLLFFTYLININRKKIIPDMLLGLSVFSCILFFTVNIEYVGRLLVNKFPFSRTAELMATGRIFDLSGRGEYYIACIKEMLDNPLKIRGFLSDRIFMGRYFERYSEDGIFGSYAHNILVELSFQFGVFGVIVCFLFIILFLRSFIKIYKMKKEYPELCVLFLIASSFSIGQLLLSDSYLTALSFGLICGMLRMVYLFWRKFVNSSQVKFFVD